MKNTIALACAAVLAVSGGLARADEAGFDLAEKKLLRGLASEVKVKLGKAVQIGDKAVTILPVRGDKDGYMEQQLIESFVDAKLTVVISNDEKKDERFMHILKEIRWDAAQKRLSSVDPSTIDELGRLKSTQVFVEATLDIVRTESKSGKKTIHTAELNLLAYAIETKKYIWCATVVGSDAEDVKSSPVALVGVVASECVPLVVKTEVKAASPDAAPVADRLDTKVRGMLAELGYRLDTGDKPDVTLEVYVSKSTFDLVDEYYRFEGTLKVKASVGGAEPKLLGEDCFDARGDRGFGKSRANANLAEAFFEQLSSWVKRTIKADVIGFEAVAFEVRFPGPVEGVADFAPIEAFRKTVMSMDGVRSCTLVGQDKVLNFATYRVAYEKAKFPTGFLNALFAAHPELDKLLGE